MSKDALTKLGVVPEMSRRLHEYKNAADTFLATQNERRRTGRRPGGGIGDGAGRRGNQHPPGACRAGARELVDRSPLSAEEDALRLGTGRPAGISRTRFTPTCAGGSGEVTSSATSSVTGRPPPAAKPRQALARLQRSPGVAVSCTAPVPIHLGRSSRRGLSSHLDLGSDTMAGGTAGRRRRPRPVRAVGPAGGQPRAAPTSPPTPYAGEVVRVREAGKPVVVSMGDRCRARPATSSSPAADASSPSQAPSPARSGCSGAKRSFATCWTASASPATQCRGPQRARCSPRYHRFTADEWRRLEDWLDQVYDDFTGKVAVDRGLAGSTCETVARGRVWTGADARDARPGRRPRRVRAGARHRLLPGRPRPRGGHPAATPAGLGMVERLRGPGVQ